MRAAPTVVLLPPTPVASIHGKLRWPWGYPLALC